MTHRTRISIAGVVFTLAFLAGARRAEAKYPAAALSWSHGQMTGGARYGSDDWNLGIGARGGYTLANGVYIGGMLDYFLGESVSMTSGGTTASANAHVWDIGAEGGFDFALTDAIMVRPFLGLGIETASGEACIDQIGGPMCTSVSANDSFLEVGGLINYFTGSLLLGGDVRLLAGRGSPLIIGGHLGFMF